MWRVSPVPFEEMDEGMRAIVRASDEALGGAEGKHTDEREVSVCLSFC